MPDELASDACAAGNFVSSASNSVSCASFAGCCGSSAQARWLITSRTSIPSKACGLGREALNFGGRHAKPRHAAVDLQRSGQFCASRAWRHWRHASTCSTLFSTGMTSAAAQASSPPGGTPLSACISGPRPSAVRNASASLSCATKKVVQPSVASAEGRFGRAKTVAVGLYDAGRCDTAELALENAVVLADRPEINRQDRSGQSR